MMRRRYQNQAQAKVMSDPVGDCMTILSLIVILGAWAFGIVAH